MILDRLSIHVSRLTTFTREFGLSRGAAMYWRFAKNHRGTPQSSNGHAPIEFGIPEAPDRVRLRPGSDMYVYEQVFLHHDYLITDWPQTAALREAYDTILRAGNKPLVVDCGANIGLSAIWFSSMFPKATVVAIEPDESNFAALTRNVEQRSQVVPLQAGVWDRPTSLKIANEGAEAWALQVKEDRAGEGGIQAVTIPEILASDRDYRLLIVKIDIEGAEVQLFRSNTEWVDITPLLIIELHDWQIPWRSTGHAFFRTTSRVERDYRIRGENMYAFLHPQAALAAVSQVASYRTPLIA
jgi:FkbM family methyltransferase